MEISTAYTIGVIIGAYVPYAIGRMIDMPVLPLCHCVVGGAVSTWLIQFYF